MVRQLFHMEFVGGSIPSLATKRGCQSGYGRVCKTLLGRVRFPPLSPTFLLESKPKSAYNILY